MQKYWRQKEKCASKRGAMPFLAVAALRRAICVTLLPRSELRAHAKPENVESHNHQHPSVLTLCLNLLLQFSSSAYQMVMHAMRCLEGYMRAGTWGARPADVIDKGSHCLLMLPDINFGSERRKL